MPFAGFDDFDDCLDTMQNDEGHDEESAQNICGALQAEHKSDHGDVAQLREALSRGAGLIADVGVDLVSGVDVPAVDSKWVMLKSDDESHDYRVNARIVLDKQDDEDDEDEEQRISYAAAMIPRETDKEGDVVATPTVEKAAHNFLKEDGGVDTDHSLIDGDGEVVESWVLKQDREFNLPGGATETYHAGTWMVGVEWGADAWQRIKDGELTGLSIYGMAEHVPLEKNKCGCKVDKQDFDDPCWDGYTMVGTKVDENGNEVPNCVPDDDVDDATQAAGVPLTDATATSKQLDIPLANESVVHLVYESRTAAEKASDEIGLNGAVHEHEFDGMTVFMPGETHDEFVERYMELSEENSEDIEQSLSQTKDESDRTVKGENAENDSMGSETTDSDDDGGPDIAEVAASVESLTEQVSALTEKVESQETKQPDEGMGELINEFAERIVEAQDGGRDIGEVKSKLRRALEDEGKADDMDEEDEDEDDEMEASADDVEKRASEANLSKGTDGEATREKAIAAKENGGASGTLSYRELAAQQEDN